VLDTLQHSADLKGSPAYIGSDNGSEFINQIIQDWCFPAGVKTLYIEPDSQWQNGFIERFHSRFRDECLNQEIFFSIAETRVVVEDYRRLHNGERLHSSLGFKTPDELAQNLTIPRYTANLAAKVIQFSGSPQLIYDVRGVFYSSLR